MAINKPAANSDYERIVIASAIASRLLLLFFIIFWRSLLSPYDTSASLNPACLIDQSSPPLAEQPVLFPGIGSAIESSIVWDGVYFVRIAQCGYEYEKSYAFLPLLPFCISLLSRTGLLITLEFSVCFTELAGSLVFFVISLFIWLYDLIGFYSLLGVVFEQLLMCFEHELIFLWLMRC